MVSVIFSLVAFLAVQVPQATWTFSYPDDGKPGSVLDLRYLNEKRAGETGYVHVGADGKSFVRGDGKPIRFWPVDSYGFRLKPEQMESNARFLAKMGVNMVRLHASISPKGKGRSIDDYDAEEIDRIQRYVAACEKEGIYVTLSPYWANGGHSGASASWGLGYADGEDIWGLLFFNRRLQSAYKGWLKHLYLDKNPYTGVALGKDSAIAIAQVQNEDSLLFWTFQGIKPAQKALLSKEFGEWSTKTYGSSAAVQERWKGAEQKGDDWSNTSPALLDTWVLTQPQSGATKTRVDDQTAFLIDIQKSFYTDIDHYLKSDLGYKGLTNASNWITADPTRLNDAERYTYLPTDVEAVNRYYNGGEHIGPNSGWRVDEGDFFSDLSALKDPGDLPFNLKQVVGHPTIITESGWVTPLEYQAEGPLLCAAYESLTGIQGLYWFDLGAEKYNTDASFTFVTTKDGSHPLSKWEAATPAILGQFPAAALLYRMGYVKRGEPVIHEERTRQSIVQRDKPLISEGVSFDPNHNAGANKTPGVVTGDPRAYLVGPVEVKYDGDPQKTKVTDISRFIDGTFVKSNTGQLSIDGDKGLFKLDSPKAQAVCGFLKASGATFQLSDLSITAPSDYASITAVSMDDLPLKTSKKVLIQIGSICHPTGWKQSLQTMLEENGKPLHTDYKVIDSGKMPWQVTTTNISISLDNLNLTKVTELDPAGYPIRQLDVKRIGQRLTIQLPADAMYVLLQ